MGEQEAIRQQLFDDLDAVEATAKHLVGDESREALQGQNTIIDGVNVQRHAVAKIPRPAASTAERAEPAS